MAADAWELRTARLEGAYEQIDKRLGAVEARLGAVEGRLGSVEARIGSVEHRLGAIEQRMDSGFVQVRTEIGGLRSDMHKQFYCLLGVLVSGLLGVGSGLLALAFKLNGH